MAQFSVFSKFPSNSSVSVDGISVANAAKQFNEQATTIAAESPSYAVTEKMSISHWITRVRDTSTDELIFEAIVIEDNDLVDKAFEQIEEDMASGDRTSIDELLLCVPKGNLVAFLSEKRQNAALEEGIISEEDTSFGNDK